MRRNLARIIKNENPATEFDDPSEPIYTDPSMFERSRYDCDFPFVTQIPTCFTLIRKNKTKFK